MPHPTSSLSTLRPELAGSLEEFDLAADRAGFIAPQVLPVIEVAKSSGIFGKIPIEQLLENRETRRAPGTGYARSHWDFTTDSYATEEHGAEEPVDDREADLYVDFFDAELVSAQRARDVVLRNMEKRVADMVFNASTWTPTSVTNEWDDVTAATPITDVAARVKALWDATGLWANALIVNRRVFLNVRRCSEIIDKVKAVKSVLPAEIGIAELQDAFDLPYIIVAGSAKNTANSEQSVSISPIWSDEYAAVARICTSNDIREPGLGRMFHWGQDGSSIGATMESYRDETVRSDIIRARMDTDEKILFTECLQLLDNITT